MSKPEDISQEAWDAAYEAFSDAIRDERTGQEIIARAIMAAKAEEREACASYLEIRGRASPLGHESVQRGQSTYNWLAHCADLIRKRGEA